MARAGRAALLAQAGREVGAIGHAWVQHAAKVAHCARYRRTEASTVMLGGTAVVDEAVRRQGAPDGGAPMTIVATTAAYEARMLARAGSGASGRRPLPSWLGGACAGQVFCVRISDAVARFVTREASPEGILAEVGRPAAGPPPAPLRRVLVLLSPAQPGNVGALIRSAAAFGWDCIVIVGGGADPFSYDAIRAAAGASLIVPIARLPAGAAVEAFCREYGLVPVVAGATHGRGMAGAPSMATLSDPRGRLLLAGGGGGGGGLDGVGVALILGSESHGVASLPASFIRDECATVAIPICAAVDSLNVAVAGGLLMSALSIGGSLSVGRAT